MDAFADLLAAARAGGHWAWRRIYDDYSPALLGYLYRQGADDPEDVLGDVWLQVAKSIHDFEGDESNFRSWLFVIAHRRLVDGWRKRKRRPAIAMEPSGLPEQPAVSAEAAYTTESLDSLEVILRPLTANQRTVILLRFGADLSIKDVAEAMKKSEGSVKLLQHRALAQIKKSLRDP